MFGTSERGRKGKSRKENVGWKGNFLCLVDMREKKKTKREGREIYPDPLFIICPNWKDIERNARKNITFFFIYIYISFHILYFIRT